MTNRFKGLIIFNYSLLILTSCSVQKQISRSAKKNIINDSSFLAAHTGISIYDPAANKYLYNYQGDKYFVPASNTKIATCYAAMKYLGDSLVGLRYQNFSDTAINIIPTGDPTFLHPDFTNQLVFSFMKSLNKKIYFSSRGKWEDDALGFGWSWNDFSDSYMTERSSFPIHGNIVKARLVKNYLTRLGASNRHINNLQLEIIPSVFSSVFDSIYVLPFEKTTMREFADSAKEKEALQYFDLKRDRDFNKFNSVKANRKFSETEIPFVTYKDKTALEILANEYHFNIISGILSDNSLYAEIPEHLKVKVIHSQPTDSLLKPMMHRSDNFFAEQTLLMISNERLHTMNDEKIIDTILKTDFKDLPQKPRWVDGSGLSRYNLFTPQSLIAILNKMKNEFGMDRIKVILPTGGEGTISNYYKADSGYIYAKTGTLSGVVALSGFLYTKKNKLLIFSVLVNNHRANSGDIRRAVERFLEGVRNK